MTHGRNQNKSSTERVRESQMWKSGSPGLSGQPGTRLVGGRDGARVLGMGREAWAVEWRVWAGWGGMQSTSSSALQLTCIQSCLNQTGLSPPVPSLDPASLASHLRPSIIRFHFITSCMSLLGLGQSHTPHSMWRPPQVPPPLI